ncbi:hypothetical protein [Owenweeksia hongkongensis]|uniref:Uncharacterized protein n=1 Tax=Owenweeksia hongkongensis (strain DSM 17368 / CIP 108786 / JCM 12287 / NRRL B-23963 / UST20020801) TaxID=926562 RepID=G8R1C8_OWEHD|nr:hypothetical protein [Owenweeksia hongkongensis]AEV33871.1 hypothetical protein Oweho_2914 [Owenweeksia hongkongensis DSM 17368]
MHNITQRRKARQEFIETEGATEALNLMEGSALAFGGDDSKSSLSKTGKLRRIEEITRSHLGLIKRSPSKGRSLDLFGSFWVKPKTNRNKNIAQL